MGTNRELVVAASLAERAAASNRSMKISAIIAVPSVIRSTRLDGRAELSVQVVDLRVRYGPACVAELATLSAKRPVSTTVPRCSWSICPLRETCYFAPNICSSPPSWLDRQRAAPFLEERDTNGLCASAWSGPIRVIRN